jgi:glycosyltransferase involved in cell wall biosynthesis
MRIAMIAFTNIEYTIELSEALSKCAELTLMIPREQAQRFQDVMDPDLKLNAFSQPRLREVRNFLFVYEIVKQIRGLNPDVIHIQRGHPWFNFGLYFLDRHCIVTTIHDVTLHSGDRESSIIPQFTHRLAVKHAKQIIVHGEELKHEMIRKYNIAPEDINVLHRGVNSIYTRYIDGPIEEEDHTILFFGRIFGYKGLQYLVEAEPLITKEIPGLRIIIAGRGEDVNKLFRDKMINKDRYTIYNKHIPNTMVPELFQRASVVVLPYTDASQSGVVPLAYAFKKPVVVTNVGSLPEVVDDGETGCIVPPRDSEKLASAVINLLKNNEKRKRMGQNAYKKTQEELSWDNIAIRTMDVYKKAMGRPHR